MIFFNFFLFLNINMISFGRIVLYSRAEYSGNSISFKIFLIHDIHSISVRLDLICTKKRINNYPNHSTFKMILAFLAFILFDQPQYFHPGRRIRLEGYQGRWSQLPMTISNFDFRFRYRVGMWNLH